LISEPAIQLDVTFSEKNVEKSAANTVKFTIKFCMKHNMKFIFAMKRNKKLNPEGHETELNFYKKYLTNNEFDYLASNSSVKKEDKYSSYMSMHQSKVTIGYWSTMLRENLAIGGKILCCNLLPTNTWDFPVKGICLIRNCTFKEFEKRLLQIYSMPKKNYFSKINKDKCYTVKFNKKVSTIEILKNKIDYFLADKQLLKN
jgi:hypothetical protein